MVKRILTMTCIIVGFTLVSLSDQCSLCQGQAPASASLLGFPPTKQFALVIRIPQSYVSTLLNDEFDYEVPVKEVVLETASHGKATCSCQVACELEEKEGGIAFCIRVSGEVNSDTIGRNGPASIAATALTKYVAAKRLSFTNGYLVSQPASIHSETRLTIVKVDSELPGVRGVIVKRVALRKVQGRHADAERIVNEATEKGLCRQIDNKVDAQIGFLNQVLRTNSHFAYQAVLGNLVNFRSQSTGIEICIEFKTPSNQELTSFNTRSN